MIHKLNNRYELEFERTLKRYPLISDMVIGLNPKLKNSFLIDELLKLNLNVTESIEDLYLIGRITNITRYKKEKTKLSYDTVGVHINVNNYLYKYK